MCKTATTLLIWSFYDGLIWHRAKLQAAAVIEAFGWICFCICATAKLAKSCSDKRYTSKQLYWEWWMLYQVVAKQHLLLSSRAELTAKLVEVCLDFPPGVQEDSALFCADRNHAVLVYGDARHLSVELRHRHALQNMDTAITYSSSLKFMYNSNSFKNEMLVHMFKGEYLLIY